MHELSVCNALIAQVENIALQHGASEIMRIILKIGPLSGVEHQLLRNAFPLAAAATVAEKAELVIETAIVVVKCSECGAESTVSTNRLLCSSCGDFRTRILSGDELILQRVELAPPVARAGSNAAAGDQATNRR